MVKSYFSRATFFFLLVFSMLFVCACSGNTITYETSSSKQTFPAPVNSLSSSSVTINDSEAMVKPAPSRNNTSSAVLTSSSVSSKQSEESKAETFSAIKATPSQTKKSISKASTQSGNTINIGDYVRFGNYNDEPILWKCVDKDQNSGTMLISEYVLCLKPYDAAESGKCDVPDVNNKENIQNDGSNVWIHSNIREWLNSSEKVVKYSTHPPTNDAVRFGNNDFDTEPGFLYNFTEEERSKIISVTHEDGAKDQVYLLSLNEVDTYIGPRSAEHKRIRQITQKAKQNSEYNHVTSKDNAWYWTRSPYVTTLNRIHAINENGCMVTGYPCIGDYGVLPAINLKSDVAKSGNGKKDEPFVP